MTPGYHEWLAATIGPKVVESDALLQQVQLLLPLWTACILTDCRLRCGFAAEECALSACFRRLDAEANGYITRNDIERHLGGGASARAR